MSGGEGALDTGNGTNQGGSFSHSCCFLALWEGGPRIGQGPNRGEMEEGPLGLPTVENCSLRGPGKARREVKGAVAFFKGEWPPPPPADRASHPLSTTEAFYWPTQAGVRGYRGLGHTSMEVRCWGSERGGQWAWRGRRISHNTYHLVFMEGNLRLREMMSPAHGHLPRRVQNQR